ncbi:penicillin-binding protein activator, partial [Salmonella enterica]|uniref:penicillin-binding protein activator n=1 Tax=Salmonella enterica TaxID=28901 RepID=UPI000D585CCD
RDAAHHIYDQGKQSPLLLIPRSTLGDRVANAFTQEWQKLGGGRVDAVYILATPEEIGFIKPMIAMRNGTQSGATLYASSRS